MSMIHRLGLAAILAAASVTAQAAPRHATPDSANDHALAIKRAACEKVWTAQKVKHGARAAFIAACVAKG